MGKEGTECWGQRDPSGTGQDPGRATNVAVKLKCCQGFMQPGRYKSCLFFPVGYSCNIGATELRSGSVLEKVRQGNENELIR